MYWPWRFGVCRRIGSPAIMSVPCWWKPLSILLVLTALVTRRPIGLKLAILQDEGTDNRKLSFFSERESYDGRNPYSSYGSYNRAHKRTQSCVGPPRTPLRLIITLILPPRGWVQLTR